MKLKVLLNYQMPFQGKDPQLKVARLLPLRKQKKLRRHPRVETRKEQLERLK